MTATENLERVLGLKKHTLTNEVSEIYGDNNIIERYGELIDDARSKVAPTRSDEADLLNMQSVTKTSETMRAEAAKRIVNILKDNADQLLLPLPKGHFYSLGLTDEGGRPAEPTEADKKQGYVADILHFLTAECPGLKLPSKLSQFQPPAAEVGR